MKVGFVLAQRAPKMPQSFSDQNGQLSVPNVIFEPEFGRRREELIMNLSLYKSHS